MCGIAGYVGPGLSPHILDPLLDSMAHRGPDGTGTHHCGPVHIGMRRLSVIDLSGGWQPLTSRDGRVVAFQNGEIYNYRDLRADLAGLGYRFATESDTEVLAHGYDAWSIGGLVQRLDGMFAIAIHDRDSGMLHLARDRFGEKPLYYAAGPEAFGFGSTLLSVASMPWVDDEVDRLSLHRYLALHFVPGDRTILSSVRQVLPGEYLSIDTATLHIDRSRYYLPPLRAATACSDRDLARALDQAVSSRLVADVPVGVFLSGGLDSSLVAAIAARHHAGIATFSMGFADSAVDESSYAAAVAREIGSDHHSFVFDQSHFCTLLAKVAESLDAPIGDQAMLPLFWLCQEARKHVTVALSGEGADELFGGYSYYRSFANPPGEPPPRAFLRRLLGRPRSVEPLDHPDRLISDAKAASLSGFPILTNPDERHRLVGAAGAQPDAWENSVLSWLASSREPLQRATAADVGSWLPDDLLVKFDRMAMAHSLEGRAPFLAPTLAELGLTLPSSQRMGSESKVALRRVARRFLPPELIDRPKQGFVLPMRKWLAEWFSMFNGASGYFSNRDFPGLDHATLISITQADLDAGVDRERLLFAVVMLLEWWRSFKRRRSRLSAELGKTRETGIQASAVAF